jgi:hypothetical protein
LPADSTFYGEAKVAYVKNYGDRTRLGESYGEVSPPTPDSVGIRRGKGGENMKTTVKTLLTNKKSRSKKAALKIVLNEPLLLPWGA